MKFPHRGFTLLEMLVGLALIGLMSIVLFSALRFGTHSWERLEGKASQVVDFRTAEHVLRREIGKAFPMRIGLPNENKIAFEGDARRLRFITALPSHFSAGGLSRVELRFEPVKGQVGLSDGGVLLLRHAPQDGLESEVPEGEPSLSSKIVEGLESVTFAYFGRETESAEPRWQEVWKAGERLPALVRIAFKFAAKSEPSEIIIPVRLGEEAGCYQAAFQRACGPRR